MNAVSYLQEWLHSLNMTLRAEPSYGFYYEISTPILRIRNKPGRDELWILSATTLYTLSGEELTEVPDIPNLHNYDIVFDQNDNAWILAADGMLYMSGNDGVVRININEDAQGNSDVQLIVPYIETDNEIIYLTPGEKVVLPSKTRRLWVHPFALTYSLTELSLARDIQASVLPRVFPDRKEIDLYASMDPAQEGGGDFYDYFQIDKDHLALVIADVSGKGVGAALFMMVAKNAIKSTAMSGGFSGPGEILRDVNSKMCEDNDASLFVTVWLGILTLSTGRLVTANAGHEYPGIWKRATASLSTRTVFPRRRMPTRKCSETSVWSRR